MDRATKIKIAIMASLGISAFVVVTIYGDFSIIREAAVEKSQFHSEEKHPDPVVSTERSVSNSTLVVPGSDGYATSPGFIRIAQGRVSLHLESQSLLNSLNEVSRLSETTIVAAINDRKISAIFENLPVDQAVRELARGYDFFVYYDGGTGVPKSMWIYMPGEGNNIAPISDRSWMTDPEVRVRLVDADPEVRARAIETIIDRAGSRAMDWIVTALRDQSDIVRYRTLQKTVEASVVLPMDVLRDILRHDPSALARFIALNALEVGATSDPYSASEAVRMVLNDPDEAVKSHAHELLFKWGKK